MHKFKLRRLGVADDPGSYKPTLQSCLEAVLDQCDALIDDVLLGLRSVTATVPGKATMAVKVTPQTREGIEILERQAPALKAAFNKSLRVALYGGHPASKPEQPLVRFDDFQFLEEEQINANIEFALSQQEVLLAVDDVLPTLNPLISSLLGWVTVQAHLNPLRPESFVQALRDSFLEIIPDEGVRASVMPLAAGKFGISLRHLYRELADWLRSQGVEPVMVVQAQFATGLGGITKATETTISRTMLTLDKLRRLLSGELDTGPVAAGAGDFMHTVPASFEALQDMKLVEPMMKRLAARASQNEPHAPSATTAGVDGGQDVGQTKRLGLQLGQEVVRLMLENLMQDRRLLPPVREGLKSLESVLIQLSQRDPRFFSDRQHPARQLLDKLTHRSLAFPTEEVPGFARFQKMFDNAVNVLTCGEGDSTSFARVLRKLEENWARDEREQRQRAEEAARGLLHAEQRHLLAQRLSSEFTERMVNKRVPDMVVSFLRGPWAQAVAQAQLTSVDGSGDTSDYKALVDDLIWSVQLKLARRNRARLVQILPSMLVRMRQGLAAIGYPEEKMTAFFDDLITFHEKAFETAKASQSVEKTEGQVDRVAPQVLDIDPGPESFWMAEDEAADSGFLDDAHDMVDEISGPADAHPAHAQDEWSANSLETGSWVDLALGNTWVRAQLTWASPQRTLFMFISGAGMAHSMSLRTMERLRGVGLIRLVSDGRVMDNALDAVAQAALRNDVHGESSSG